MVNGADAGVLYSFAITVDNTDQRNQVLREDGTRYDYSYDAVGQKRGHPLEVPVKHKKSLEAVFLNGNHLSVVLNGPITPWRDQP